eukprot:3013158-Pyramimonas_sp.AAC.1
MSLLSSYRNDAPFKTVALVRKPHLEVEAWRSCVSVKHSPTFGLASCRLVRIRRAIIYIDARQYDISINAVLILGLKFGMVLWVSLHWVGCFCYMVASINDFDKTTWPSYITDHGSRLTVPNLSALLNSPPTIDSHCRLLKP